MQNIWIIMCVSVIQSVLASTTGCLSTLPDILVIYVYFCMPRYLFVLFYSACKVFNGIQLSLSCQGINWQLTC